MDRPNKPSALNPSAAGPQPTVSVDQGRVTAALPTGDSVEILLFGATVTSWKSSSGHENLWLSTAAKLDGSKPVRGGIPLVFPVFGPPPQNHATSTLPQHGFARNSTWAYLGKTTSEGDSIKLDFGLSTPQLSPTTQSAWPHAVSLVYSVELSKGTLKTMLHVQNTSDRPFDFQMLLHTYFATSDVSKTELKGLGSVTYVDKMLDSREMTQRDAVVRFGGEVDRVYKGITVDTTSVVVDGRAVLDVTRDNLGDTVVWNPWVEKSKGMGDFEPKEGYKRMVCVEVGAVDGWQTLEPGETFEGGQIVKSHL